MEEKKDNDDDEVPARWKPLLSARAQLLSKFAQMGNR
jgi:hypothetical protein